MKKIVSILFAAACLLFTGMAAAQCTANAGADKLICCPGGTVQITGKSTQTFGECDTVRFQWFPATGLNNPHLKQPIFTAGSTTTFTLCIYVTNKSSGDTCCIACDQMTVTVNSTCCRIGQGGGNPFTENAPEVKIAPNPSEGKFDISFSRPLQNAEIFIYDVSGRLVWEKKSINDTDKIQPDLSGKEKGMYLIKIMENNKLVRTEKILID
ncbi:MAG: T9SS type A sorting domain-containing protein [Bacteroidia bacterium]|nr:T9SS type A sorting domain-containing protein [Bacteroidia bacterium]